MSHHASIRFFPDQPPEVIGESRFSHLLHEKSPVIKDHRKFGETEQKLSADLSDEESQQD